MINYATTKAGLIEQVRDLHTAMFAVAHFLETGYIMNNEHDVKLALETARKAIAKHERPAS